jgi:AAA+ ATPase superfamily predicted ATPase
LLAKQADVFDRDQEWADLAEFAAPDLPGLRIAVVYGHRRQGKSYLLRRLAEASGGFYHLATEQTEAISVRRFADALAAWQGMPAGALGFDGWELALDVATELMAARPAGRDAAPLLVLDEFPCLAQETAGLPSLVQSLYDRIGLAPPGIRRPCG